MLPSINSLLNISDAWFFKIENGRSIMIANTIWTRSSEKKLLSQLLKIPLVLLFIRQRKAKGESRTRTFVRIYRSANVITSVNDETVIIVAIIPSNVKISKELLLDDNFSIRAVKEIS